ncbi:GlcG/HbpS family heme-binding protein [Sinosporangium siamense]|uniref:Heme-binding protein n=1 Tax=Sinosporangium siamense TaxID=1367973 RepID=A0A919VBI1_9ACTN|nr:heme-binding protein [Sinosporangium siamense]GII96542.1 hypothetical protein Ssi02_67730 [Sinosporangium siamense]
MTQHITRTVVSGRRALTAVEAALHHAGDVRITVVVVDRAGVLVAACRHEDALPATSDLALAKARAAAGFAKPAEALAGVVQPGAPYFGLPAAVAAPIATFAGGLPLLDDGYCFGAVGVSGGTGEQDADIARVAVSAYLDQAQPSADPAHSNE